MPAGNTSKETPKAEAIVDFAAVDATARLVGGGVKGEDEEVDASSGRPLRG